MASEPIVLEPGLLQIRPQYSPNPDTGDHPENVLWFVSQNTSTPSLANLTAIADQFDQGWGSMMQACLANGAHYTGCLITDYSSAYGLSSSTVNPAGQTTGAQGAPLPSNVAILCSLRVQKRWRGGHPRIYLPWIGASTQLSTDHNQANGTTLANLTTGFQNMGSMMQGSGTLGGQSQRVYLNKTKPTEAELLQIVSFTFQATYASQRRRLRKAPHH